MTRPLRVDARAQRGALAVVERGYDDLALTLDPELRASGATDRPISITPTPDALAANLRAVASVRARRNSYRLGVLVLDSTVICITVMLGYVLRFQNESAQTEVPYLSVGLCLGLLWVFVLHWNKCYDDRVLGYGSEEYRRVVSASLKLAGVVAILAYLIDNAVARGFLGITFMLGMVLLPAGRWLVRKPLYRRRHRGDGWTRRVLVVGDAPTVVHLANQLRRDRHVGYHVVGACIPDTPMESRPQQVGGVPVVGSFNRVLEAATALGADTVAVTGSVELSGLRLRRLGWQMEGTGIDLVVAPALTDVAGPRIHTQPVAGLPLIHVSSPEFRGTRKWVKGAFDRIVAGAALVVLAPVFLVIALLIKRGSPGPAIFRQQRVGLGGSEFSLFKFRSMVPDAEAKLADLTVHNEGQGLLFKVRQDPRVTEIGRFLRRYSLDELPQLVNVLRGEMSLVGPRPPLPAEVAQYNQDVARRLLVKPGLTGLWQVSGRSDLSWEESVRLDLYYVENWTLAADLSILWRTVGAVLGRRGAY
jgi:exopolysaccharide biosynthesis polyprenyl glycosylphosphotransferase